MANKRVKNARQKKVLVTANNRGFLASGTPIYTFTKTSKYRGKKTYNIPPLSLAMWVDTEDGTVPTALEPADLTVAHLPKLRLATGIDMTGDGITDYLREVPLGALDGCNINDMHASGPACGVPQIEALYPGCTSCETISVRVRVDDNATRSFGPAFRSFSEFTASYTPDCATCDGCDTVPTCNEMVCGLVDDLNNKLDLHLDGTMYPHYGGGTIERPFKAVKLHDNWTAYCISGEDTACEDCVDIAALTTFTVAGTEYTFSQAVKNPADNTRTLMTQLEQAAFEIEAAIQEQLGKHAGFTHVSKGAGACCPAQLHVVSCETIVVTGLTPCQNAIVQFPTFTENGTCEECGSAGTTTTPSCGLAIIAKQDVIDCKDCFFEGVPGFLGRVVSIDIISQGTVSKHTKKATLQDAKLPGGFGLEVQAKEFRQTPDQGITNGFDPRGRYGMPGKYSKLRSIQAKCDIGYCQYMFDHRKYAEFGPNGAAPMNVPLSTTIAVPEKDTVTQTAVDALRTALITLSPNACSAIETVKCDGTAL